MTDTAPMPLNPDGTINMTPTAIAGHLESSINARWRAMYSRSFGDLLGRWVGGRCTPETRLDALAVLLDVGVGDLHVGLNVHADVDGDGRPTAFMVSNPRTCTEVLVALTPRAFRVAGATVPLEIDSAGRRIVEALAMAVAQIVASPNGGDRRKGRRQHDS